MDICLFNIRDYIILLSEFRIMLLPDLPNSFKTHFHNLLSKLLLVFEFKLRLRDTLLCPAKAIMDHF